MLDEYVGAAYVALLFCVSKLQDFFGVPFQIVIYALQLSLGVFAVYRFLAAIGKEGTEKGRKKGILLSSFFINTIPFLLQAHFSVLPYSLSASVYLLLVAVLLKIIKVAHKYDGHGANKEMILLLCGAVLLWAIGALLLPEYWQLSGVLVFACLLYGGILRKELRGWAVLGVALGTALAGMLLLLTTEEGCRGRMQNTVEAQAVRRLAWPHLETMESCWPWDIVVKFSKEELAYAAIAPERVVDVFGPRVEELFGKETANAYYAQMAKSALTYNTKKVVGSVVTDFAFYLCPQWMASRNLDGKGATYTGRIYEEMRENGRELTTLFVRWSRISMLLLGIFGSVALVATKEWKRWLGIATFLVVLQALHYTWTTAGMVSYLKCPVNLAVWGMLMTAWLWVREERGAETE